MAAAPPFKVKAVYEYSSEHGDDLTFPVGQVITVTELEGDDWYVGEYTDPAGAKQEGLFPTNFVEKYEPEVPVRPSRPARPKQEPAPPSQPAPPPEPEPAPEPAVEEPEQEEAPPLPAASKPAPPPVDVPASRPPAEEVRSPPAAPRPAPAEPPENESAPAATKKAPPPVAAKSNAFKDRIAAFNQPAAAPIAPMQPGRKPEPNFIKKPFVAPPPSKNAYVPPVTKQEPVHRPYHRDEDPEIKQREEEDRAAAEAAGLSGEQPTSPPPQGDEGEDDAPKPLTLKERMALLQKQQQEQAQRRAESAAQKKEKKPPSKRPSESSEQVVSPGEEPEDGVQRSRSTTERPSMDAPREVPPVPSSSRRPPQPMSPSATMHESSDGHEADQSGAGEMTEDDSGTLGPDKDESDEKPSEPLRHPVAPKAEPDMGDQQDTTEDDEDEEEDEMDEETRRKEELRARMARLGGGGLPGMGGPFNPFGAPPPAPPKKKASKDRKASEESPVSPRPQQAPMVPVPGMGSQRVQSPGSDTAQTVQRDAEETAQDDVTETEAPAPPKRSSTIDRAAPPPVPKDSRPVPPPPSQDRPVPPPPGGETPRPPAAEARPVPPPPPAAAPMSPGPGSESDDEASAHAKRSSVEMSGTDTPLPVRPAAPPVPGTRDISREVPPRPPQSPQNKRTSYFGSEPTSAASEKRNSRAVPPVPSDSPVTSPRPPPPPPPTQAPPSRQDTMDEGDGDEQVGSDYDGDYDTDIASSAKHKDALKASPHVREASLTENVPSNEDETPVSSPPPPPQGSAPRAVPPPPPQAAPKSRPSMDRPPPPVPPAHDAAAEDEYDPYRYEAQPPRAVPPPPGGAPRAVPPVPPPQEPPTVQEESSADEMYAPPSPPRRSMDRVPTQPPPPAPLAQAPTRTSLDAPRAATSTRRSMDQSRPSGEHSGQIAQDLPLSTDTPWWTAEQPLPPSLQSRNGVDILSECEETAKSKRGGRKEISKDIYILYMDYSQTIITARYDSQDPHDVHLEQRHEPPPPRPRQDQLEAAWQRFGTKIADAAASAAGAKKGAPAVGDETPAGLPLTLIRALPDALLPVGTRAYGAPVYANLANASTQQHDEIRRGDVLTLRGARFEGHAGAMKTKYKADYGAGHVAVVEEWDGTRRSVRCWEQGRENKKGGVRSEKFRLGDLRSGEVRVWRVVGREWVGWDS